MIGSELKKYLQTLGYTETILVDYFVNDPAESLALNNHIIIETRPSSMVDFRDKTLEIPLSIYIRKTRNENVNVTSLQIYNDLTGFNGYLDNINYQFRIINVKLYPPYKYTSLKNLHISVVRADFIAVDNNRVNA